MLKAVSIVSMIAFGAASAVSAAEHSSSAMKSESANRHGSIVVGSAHSNVASAAPQSGVRAPVFVPVTPFVSYAMSGHAENDVELQRQVQDIQEREQRLFQNAEYRDLLRARQRLGLSQAHPDLRQLLQVTKEQADQLLDLLAEQQIRERVESRPMLPDHRDAVAVQAFIEKGQERERANEAQVAELLGASKFQEWKEYEQSGMARFLVQRFQAALSDDARLQPEQLRPLVLEIAREQRRLFEDEAFVIPPGQVPDEEWQKRVQGQQLERMAAANKRILNAVGSVLSQRQLEQLGSMLQQELDDHSRRQFFFGARAPLFAPTLLPPQP